MKRRSIHTPPSFSCIHFELISSNMTSTLSPQKLVVQLLPQLCSQTGLQYSNVSTCAFESCIFRYYLVREGQMPLIFLFPITPRKKAFFLQYRLKSWKKESTVLCHFCSDNFLLVCWVSGGPGLCELYFANLWQNLMLIYIYLSCA